MDLQAITELYIAKSKVETIIRKKFTEGWLDAIHDLMDTFYTQDSMALQLAAENGIDLWKVARTMREKLEDQIDSWNQT